MVVTCGSRHVAAMAWMLSRSDGVDALASPPAPSKRSRGQLFSRKLPEARSGSKFNWRGARYRSGKARALVGAAFRAPHGTF